MKTILLKSWALLLLMMVSMGAWAEEATIASWTYAARTANSVYAPTSNDANNSGARLKSECALNSAGSGGSSSAYYGSWTSGKAVYVTGLNMSGYTDKSISLTINLRHRYSGTAKFYYSTDGTSYPSTENVSKSITNTSADYVITSIPNNVKSIKVVISSGTAGNLWLGNVTIKGTPTGGGSSDPVDASWSVSPATVSVKATKTETVSITTNYDGTLSVASNNTGVATATINGKVITVTGVAEGNTTLTVTGAATSAYNAISKTIDVTVTPNVVTPGTYDITPNNAFWGTSYNGSISSVTANSLTLNGESDDITVQLKNGTSTNGYINDAQTRVYNGYTMKFNVPTGFDITAIAFTEGSAWAGTHTASVGTMTDNKHWTGTANEVTINFKGTCQITDISVTYAEHVAPTVTYTVTFNAGTNGSCATSELTEASVGAGVTLPNVTANAGFDFIGWSTDETPVSANAGVAGETYYPTEDCTLYAYYTKQIPSFSGAFIDFDLSTDNTATATEDKMTWINTLVNIAVAKSSSTTAANNYYPGASTPRISTRFYTNSTLTFTPATSVTITGIEFIATTDAYATAFANSTWTNGDAVASSTTAYVTPEDGTRAVSATIGATTGGTKFRVYYTCPDFEVTTADDDFYSLYLDYAVTIPSNVTAYTGSLEGKTLKLSAIEGTIPANTGVVFKTKTAGTATFVAAADVNPIEGNVIKGVAVETAVSSIEAGAGNVVLVLGMVNDGKEVGFAQPKGETLAANKAYIIAPAAVNGIRMIIDGEETGIEAISEATGHDLQTTGFNLQGQRVKANAKGIVIMNGKKYFVK